MDHTLPYKASLTREQFLFYEMRTTVKLLIQGDSEKEAIKIVAKERGDPKSVVYKEYHDNKH